MTRIDGQEETKSFLARYYSLFILIAIVITTFIFYITFHLRFSWATYGVDGSYYDLHVNYILLTGRMLPQYEDPPFIFHYFALLALILGNTTIGIKVGVSLLISLMPIPTFFLLKKVFKRSIISLVASFLIAFNPYMIRLSGDFLKEVGGVFFFLCFLYFFIAAIQSYEPYWGETGRLRLDKYILKNYRVFFVFLFLFLIFITHIYPAGFCVIVIFLYILITSLYKWKPPWRELQVLAIPIVGLILGMVGMYLLDPNFVEKYTKILDLLGEFGIVLMFTNSQILLSSLLQMPPGPPNQLPIVDFLIKMMMFAWQPVILATIILLPLIIGVVILVVSRYFNEKRGQALKYSSFLLMATGFSINIFSTSHEYFLFFLFPPLLGLPPEGYQLVSGISSIFQVIFFFCSLAFFLIGLGMYLRDLFLKRKQLNKVHLIVLVIFIANFTLSLTLLSPELMEWSQRFIMLNFLSVCFISAYFLSFIPPSRRVSRGVAVVVICTIFFTSAYLFTFSSSVSTHPEITYEEYLDLLDFRQLVLNGTFNSSSILMGKEFNFGYTIMLVTGLKYDYLYDNASLAESYHVPIYEVIKNNHGPLPYPVQYLNFSGRAIWIFIVNWTYL